MRTNRRAQVIKVLFGLVISAAALIAAQALTSGIVPAVKADGPRTHCPIYPCGGGPPPACIELACEPPIGG